MHASRFFRFWLHSVSPFSISTLSPGAVQFKPELIVRCLRLRLWSSITSAFQSAAHRSTIARRNFLRETGRAKLTSEHRFGSVQSPKESMQPRPIHSGPRFLCFLRRFHFRCLRRYFLPRSCRFRLRFCAFFLVPICAGTSHALFRLRCRLRTHIARATSRVLGLLERGACLAVLLFALFYVAFVCFALRFFAFFCFTCVCFTCFALFSFAVLFVAFVATALFAAFSRRWRSHSAWYRSLLRSQLAS